jgi:hypothetical protein
MQFCNSNFFLEYGYGSTAIVFVCLIALVGVITVPCLKKKVYETVLMILTALSVGVMLSCALLHLLPRVNNYITKFITVDLPILKLERERFPLFVLKRYYVLALTFLGVHRYLPFS